MDRIRTGIAVIDLDVMADRPSERLESFAERLKIVLGIRIVLIPRRSAALP